MIFYISDMGYSGGDCNSKEQKTPFIVYTNLNLFHISIVALSEMQFEIYNYYEF